MDTMSAYERVEV